VNIFLSLQNEIKALLQAQSYFTTIPIVIEDKGEITAEVNKALAEGAVATASDVTPKYGIAMLIITPSFKNITDRPIEAIQLEIDVEVGIYEQVPVNTDPTTGINKRALELCHNTIWYIGSHRAARGFTPIRFGDGKSTSLPDISTEFYSLSFSARRAMLGPAT
jgi:hypothetical protein